MYWVACRAAARILLCATFAFSSAVHAAESPPFPAKPVRIIVASSANSGGDFIGRLLAPRLTDIWTQPVLVEARPGAGSIIGTEIVAKAAPDGYNVVIVPSSFALNPALYRKLPYDSAKDLAAVTVVGTQPTLGVVHPTVPIRTVRDLINIAKPQPGRVNYASSGVGSGGFLAAELLKKMAGIQMTHVPYKGPAPALVDLLGGQVDLLFTSPLAALPHVHAKRLRALAVTSSTRATDLPDIPTVAESGVPGYEVLVWNVVLAPGGTPTSVINRLASDITRTLQLPDIKTKLQSLGYEARGGTPEAAAQFLRSETTKWTKVIQEAGIEPQ